MAKKTTKEDPIEIPPGKEPGEMEPFINPEEPFLPEETPDIIPEEDPYRNPPYEIPAPGEGP